MQAQDKKILLYQLTQTVRALYPSVQTRNPYREQIHDYLSDLDVCQQLLFDNLLHALTLLNQGNRARAANTLESSCEDVSNALQLLLLSSKLSPKSLDTYQKLKGCFNTDVFSLVDAQRATRKGRSTLLRHFKGLRILGLLCEVPTPGNKKYYQLKEYALVSEILTEQTPFEEAFEEWEDYSGWMDTQMRT